jgi:hypothetical protein
LYAISYILQTGTVIHRARSATAALEAMDLLKAGGAAVIRVVATKSGNEVSVAELRLLAGDEVGVSDETGNALIGASNRWQIGRMRR